jgi:hypothetical protein
MSVVPRAALWHSEVHARALAAPISLTATPIVMQTNINLIEERRSPLTAHRCNEGRELQPPPPPPLHSDRENWFRNIIDVIRTQKRRLLFALSSV